MKKGIIKATAIVLLSSVLATCFPIDNIYAAGFVVSAGGSLAAGNGSSMRDIKALIVRNSAKKKDASVKNQGTSTEVSVESETEIVITSVESDVEEGSSTNEVKAPRLVDESAIQKVETPSSKAVYESEVIDGESVVGSASQEAQIEITSTEETTTDEGDTVPEDDVVVAEAPGEEMPGEDGEQEVSETEPDETPESSSNESVETPVIDIKPEGIETEEGEEDLSDRVIADCDGYVNVRSTPDESGEVVGKLYNHSAGVWLGKEGDWYKIESGNVVGYVKGLYVKTGQAAIKLAAEVGQRTAVVTTTTLKIREEASTESTVLGLVPMEDRLSVLEETDEWVKVSIEEGDGWVSKEYVAVTTEFPKAESKAEEEARLKKEEEERRKANAAANKAVKNKNGSTTTSGATYSVAGSGLGSAVANYGLQFVGNPYVYGGTSLTNGTDCSGFTMGVYRNFGVSLPHSSGAQRSCGYAVGSLAEAQPGDLICYSGHVAIYIGNGQIVHASTAKTGIKVSNVSYRSILAIRRIF